VKCRHPRVIEFAQSQQEPRPRPARLTRIGFCVPQNETPSSLCQGTIPTKLYINLCIYAALRDI
jgi:hypothetical protein